MSSNSTRLTVRILHRYLGFFLAGIMFIYALSGIIMIFRETNFLKKETIVERQLAPGLTGGELSPMLRMGVRVEKTDGDILYFEQGQYNQKTGLATVTKMELPFVLEKMERLHKATTNSPLYFLNIFFGLSLIFFVVSAFWMYSPSMKPFRKGLYFTAAGIVLTCLLLFL